MNIKLSLATVVCVYMVAITTPCNAVTYLYSGVVVEATGAIGQLIPVGTPVIGNMIFADAAVQAGFVGENDLVNLDVQVGGFCIYLHYTDCVGLPTPLNLIDSVGITFDIAGNVTGGEISAALFSPADPYIPWLFDFDTNTLVSNVPGLGIITANTILVPALPIPGAIWLFGSASLLLVFWRKK